MPAFLFNIPANGQQRIYLDESGTLGFGGEIFTMAMVLVRDLPKLEACTLRNRTTQSEVKASQMKTAQKLALARTLLEENDIDVYLAKLDPLAAMASERKLDKELLYDSMVAQALAHYLANGAMARNLPYRISMDMRGGLRESYEDMVAESIGNVLMHRPDPLVAGLDVRFLDSKYSAGVQAADLFSNVYRTALAQPESPCRNFLRKYQELGRVHAGFTFGLVELADQMAQIAADLRARILLEGASVVLDDGLSPARAAAGRDLPETKAPEGGASQPTVSENVEESRRTSRSARRRRSRATRRLTEDGANSASEQPEVDNVSDKMESDAGETTVQQQPVVSTAPIAGPASPEAPEVKSLQTDIVNDSDDHDETQAQAVAAEGTAQQPKPDVRPRRASRSRQSARATSKRKAAAVITDTAPAIETTPTVASSVAVEPTADATAESKPAPTETPAKRTRRRRTATSSATPTSDSAPQADTEDSAPVAKQLTKRTANRRRKAVNAKAETTEQEQADSTAAGSAKQGLAPGEPTQDAAAY